MASNISQDLIWQICRNNSSWLVKRKQSGGVQFSRDPLNLLNRHSSKYAGSLADRAIGIHPAASGNGVTVTIKKTTVPAHKPSSSYQTSTISGSSSSRKTYRTVANSTSKRGYRVDLSRAALARSSAIKKSQKPLKKEPATKLRGAKAKKADE